LYETDKLLVILIAGVVYISRVIFDLTQFASPYPAEPLTGRATDNYVYTFQAMFVDKGFRPGNILNIGLNTATAKVVGMSLAWQGFFVYTEPNVVVGHLEPQTHPACAAKQVQDNRF